MTEILIGAIVLFFVLALVIVSRNKYVQWLERKLATTREELRQLRNNMQGTVTEYHLRKRIAELEAMVRWQQQPWLKGATTEYHLRKRIKALEAHVPKSVLRRLDAQIDE